MARRLSNSEPVKVYEYLEALCSLIALNLLKGAFAHAASLCAQSLGSSLNALRASPFHSSPDGLAQRDNFPTICGQTAVALTCKAPSLRATASCRVIA